ARVFRDRRDLQGLLRVREGARDRDRGRRETVRRAVPQALGQERAGRPPEGEEMRIAPAAVALLLGALLLQGQQQIPDHPDKLKYPPMKFEVPDAAAIRTTLSNGAPAYLIEDAALPIVDLRI